MGLGKRNALIAAIANFADLHMNAGVHGQPQFFANHSVRHEDEQAIKLLGGSGIGLAIAKALVDAHHGRITAASAGVGRGATFTVELPSRAMSLAASRES